jgi:regulator of nonsense transcripts 1
MQNALQASQSGYAVDYVTQGAQGGFPGNFLNQNSQAGFSRFGSGNDFMSQVCLLKTPCIFS